MATFDFGSSIHKKERKIDSLKHDFGSSKTQEGLIFYLSAERNPPGQPSFGQWREGRGMGISTTLC